jgi:hypothetical protein
VENELALIAAFVMRSKRDRYREFLSSPKLRHKFTSRTVVHLYLEDREVSLSTMEKTSSSQHLLGILLRGVADTAAFFAPTSRTLHISITRTKG